MVRDKYAGYPEDSDGFRHDPQEKDPKIKKIIKKIIKKAEKEARKYSNRNSATKSK